MGTTTAAGSVTYDIAATAIIGENYGIAKDFGNGEYLQAGAKVMKDFAVGYGTHAASQRKHKAEKPEIDKDVQSKQPCAER